MEHDRFKSASPPIHSFLVIARTPTFSSLLARVRAPDLRRLDLPVMEAEADGLVVATVLVVARVVSLRSRLSPHKSAFTAPLDGWGDWCALFRAPVITEALIELGRLSRSPKR
jgi:hypothetical protein